jgi:hypothetical protein
MRPIFMAATLSVVMLLPVAAQAFELDSPSPAGGIGAANFDIDIPGVNQPGGTVLERFADQDGKDKQGKLQVFGNDIGGTYGLPNTIPGPGNETPSWYYSTPTFRAATR